MDLASYTRFIAALLFVLALIGALAWAARHFGLVAKATTSRKTKTRRLDITEVLTVDARRRLVLIRRDDIEHLILLGPERDILIEAGIKTAAQMAGPMTGPVTGEEQQA